MSKRKSKTKKMAPTKPIKIAALIFAAIKNLGETKGPTSGKIVDYITLASELPQGRIKPQVKAALKRGVEYGVLKRYRGHYFLQSGDDLTRADRIAARFAKLPVPVPVSGTIFKTACPNRVSRKKVPGTLNVPRKSLSDLVIGKNVRKVRSVPLSLTSTVEGGSYYHDKQSSSESDVD